MLAGGEPLIWPPIGHVIETLTDAGVEIADRGHHAAPKIGMYSVIASEGGFLTTRDADLADRARAYRSHWLTPPSGQRPLSRLAHNFRLAEPLAVIGRRELARIDTLIQQRVDQTILLLDLLADLPQVRPAEVPAGQRWNHYAPLLHLQLDRPREFSEHLADQGVPNSTGSFHLIPLDQRSMFTGDAPRPVPPPPSSWTAYSLSYSPGTTTTPWGNSQNTKALAVACLIIHGLRHRCGLLCADEGARPLGPHPRRRAHTRPTTSSRCPVVQETR